MSQVFPLAGRFSFGYETKGVDRFFKRAKRAYEGGESAQDFSATQIRSAAFRRVRGGYQTGPVDAALDRLEAAFIKRDRANHVAVNGQQAWMDHIANRATTLYPRILRPRNQRFASPTQGLGYRKTEVDDFIDRLAAYFDEGVEIHADEVRAVTFSAARGSRAYAEGVVDAYLARAIEVLLAVE